jgi:hypothetical protein
LTRGREVKDHFSKFFFFFAGFNALYFLCGEQESVSEKDWEKITRLLKKYSVTEAQDVLKSAAEDIDYFAKRRPIERMNKRWSERQCGEAAQEGEKWQKQLVEEADANKQLVALGQILYLIRNNLAHGSKLDSGDDEEIIRHAVGPLELLLRGALKVSQRQ